MYRSRTGVHLRPSAPPYSLTPLCTDVLQTYINNLIHLYILHCVQLCYRRTWIEFGTTLLTRLPSSPIWLPRYKRISTSWRTMPSPLTTKPTSTTTHTTRSVRLLMPSRFLCLSWSLQLEVYCMWPSSYHTCCKVSLVTYPVGHISPSFVISLRARSTKTTTDTYLVQGQFCYWCEKQF